MKFFKIYFPFFIVFLFLISRCGGGGGGSSTQSSPPPPLAITNLANHSVVQTGFIVGTSNGPSEVGISLDNGAVHTVSGLTNWSYALPVAGSSSSWKQGSSHTITVGAVSGGVIVSPQITISVTIGVNKDFNGDGFIDLVTTAPGYNAGANTGQAYTYVNQRGFSTSPSQTLTDPNGTASDFFGNAMTSCDFNGDGYGDLVIADAAYTGGNYIGAVYYYQSGGSSGLPTTKTTILTDPHNTAGDGFGTGVSAGDINGDGYCDLVVSSQDYSTNTGIIYYYQSQGTGAFSTSPTTTINDPNATASDQFGFDIAIGDINGDGYQDLVSTSIGYSGGNLEGRIYYYQSQGSSALSTSPTTTILDPHATNNDEFGYSVAIGDINGDGYQDVVVSAMGYSNSQGIVYYFQSQGSSALLTSPTTTINSPQVGSGYSFGSDLAIGDVNADGYQDLIVASNGYLGSEGIINYYQSQGSLALSTTQTKTIYDPTAPNPDSFGFAVALGDINGDGYQDLIEGSIGYSSMTGQVNYFQSNSGSLPSSPTTTMNDPNNAQNDQFGYALSL